MSNGIKEVKRYTYNGVEYKTFSQAQAAYNADAQQREVRKNAEEALEQLFGYYEENEKMVAAILVNAERLYPILWRYLGKEDVI